MRTEFLTNGDDDEVQPTKKYVGIIEAGRFLQQRTNEIMFRLDNAMLKGIRNKVIEEEFTKSIKMYNSKLEEEDFERIKNPLGRATDSDESAIHYIKSDSIKPTNNSEYSEERKQLMIEQGHGSKFTQGIKGKVTGDTQRKSS